MGSDGDGWGAIDSAARSRHALESCADQEQFRMGNQYFASLVCDLSPGEAMAEIKPVSDHANDDSRSRDGSLGEGGSLNSATVGNARPVSWLSWRMIDRSARLLAATVIDWREREALG